jgi:formylglycine-generating enzyme required for sulfatase activity
VSIQALAACAAVAIAPLAAAQASCSADLDGDGVIGNSDIPRLLENWGPCTLCAADLNADGVVNADDLATLIGSWGKVCSLVPWATILEASPDPAVVTDPALVKAIVATGFPWRVRDNATQIEMVLIPPGTFDMGCSPSSNDQCASPEYPVHAVTLTKGFYIGRYEVTQAQWQARTGSNPAIFNYLPESPNHPVEYVSWVSVTDFASAAGLRLPTEAEWEFACRAGTTTAFHSLPGNPNGTNSDSLVDQIAWFDGNSGGTTKPVGKKAPNGFGLFDMSGNVYEWVSDGYSATYYQSSPSSDPIGVPNAWERGRRGGAYVGYSGWVRSSSRSAGLPESRMSYTGVRVARSMNPAPTLAAVLPPSSDISGGITITLRGTTLTGATAVAIGGVAATNVAVVDDLTVTATVPAGTVGLKNVTVTTPSGTATRANAFLYTVTQGWYTVLECEPDPGVVKSASLRDAIAATGHPWRVRDNATQIEMLLVPPGTFNMGCSPSNASGCNSNENPVHAVTLTNAFYLGRYEVTQAQWQARMGTNPSFFAGFADSPNRPVERVSFNMIVGFLAGTGLRLSTEAEWEYAYRAGTTTAFHSLPGNPNGTNDEAQLDAIAWFSGNNGAQGTPAYGSKPVGLKAPNGLGLHDMAGNIFEFVNDFYVWNYYASSPSVNPTGPSFSTTRVARGGAWNYTGGALRASVRGNSSPSATSSVLGFRVARTP